MHKGLQEMRKKAGFKTAREFAEVMDIPVATYARYEQTPDKVPTKSAWLLADKLECSIDDVVGRTPVDVDSLRGEVQKFYDGLSDEGKRLFDDFKEFVELRERKVAKKREAKEQRTFDSYSIYYERLWLQSAEASGEQIDIVVFGSPEQKRASFEAFLRLRVRESAALEKEDEEVIAKIMEAYDRRRGTMEFDDGFLVDYSIFDMR